MNHQPTLLYLTQVYFKRVQSDDPAPPASPRLPAPPLKREEATCPILINAEHLVAVTCSTDATDPRSACSVLAMHGGGETFVAETVEQIRDLLQFSHRIACTRR